MSLSPKIKRFWPLKGAAKRLPPPHSVGSFWMNRGDRYHCGIDLYASVDTPVLATEDGNIIRTGMFTSPDQRSYWNTTYYVLFQTLSGPVLKYAELKEVSVENGQKVVAGQVLGTVGMVLNEAKIQEDAPDYIHEIKKQGLLSMLHLEVYENIPEDLHATHYLGGNCFKSEKPARLMDPLIYLEPPLEP
jgi:murein DD-endopeptidase MepM/ murein hydrolase activator NlpD